MVFELSFRHDRVCIRVCIRDRAFRTCITIVHFEHQYERVKYEKNWDSAVVLSRIYISRVRLRGDSERTLDDDAVLRSTFCNLIYQIVCMREWT